MCRVHVSASTGHPGAGEGSWELFMGRVSAWAAGEQGARPAGRGEKAGGCVVRDPRVVPSMESMSRAPCCPWTCPQPACAVHLKALALPRGFVHLCPHGAAPWCQAQLLGTGAVLAVPRLPAGTPLCPHLPVCHHVLSHIGAAQG